MHILYFHDFVLFNMRVCLCIVNASVNGWVWHRRRPKFSRLSRIWHTRHVKNTRLWNLNDTRRCAVSGQVVAHSRFTRSSCQWLVGCQVERLVVVTPRSLVRCTVRRSTIQSPIVMKTVMYKCENHKKNMRTNLCEE